MKNTVGYFVGALCLETTEFDEHLKSGTTRKRSFCSDVSNFRQIATICFQGWPNVSTINLSHCFYLSRTKSLGSEDVLVHAIPQYLM